MADPWTDSPPAVTMRMEAESPTRGGGVELEEGLEDGLRQRVLQVLEEARDSANGLSVRARDAHRAADAARLQLESISQQGDVLKRQLDELALQRHSLLTVLERLRESEINARRVSQEA